jgi:hypothetical protein
MPVLRHNWLAIALSILALTATAARGQQQEQQSQDQGAAPIPAYHSPLASAADNGNSEVNPQGLTPDTSPLAGAAYISLGGLRTTRSYWQPHVDVFATFDSNPSQSTTTQPSWSTWTSFSGGVDIHRISGSSEMNVDYTGGVMYSNDGTASNGVVQGLNFADKFSFRRSSISFFDQLSYLPEQAFGFGGLSGASLPGGGAPGLGPGFVPGQSILAGRGQSLLNSFVTEVDVHLTPRSSVTFAGGYTLQHYFDSDLLDYGDVIGQAGYNYQLSPKNTIALVYRFSGFRYSHSSQSIDDHTAQISFARRVTGRLAFQIAAGPQVAVFRTPIPGGSGSSSGGTTNPTQLYWSLNTTLQYQMQRTGLGLSYSHGVSGGSGVLAGSVNDTVTGSATRRMSRTFSSGVTAGYARNNGLTTGVTPSSQTYNYWFAGVNLTHPWGRSLGLTLSYQMQYQNSNAAFCVGPTCGTNLLRHLISVGLGWHERPLLF